MYLIEISHNRGTSYFLDYTRGFGSIMRGKKFTDKEIAEASLENIRDWLRDETSATAYYLGYDINSLCIVENNDGI